MFYVYTLVSLKDKKYYIGYTTDLRKRYSKHMIGEVSATKYRRPLKLVYYESFTNKIDALSREKYLKSGYGRDQLRKILKNTL